jgi:hypothetical protein
MKNVWTHKPSLTLPRVIALINICVWGISFYDISLRFWNCYDGVVCFGCTNFVIKFVSGLRHVGGFLRVLRFPPPIKLTATI